MFCPLRNACLWKQTDTFFQQRVSASPSLHSLSTSLLVLIYISFKGKCLLGKHSTPRRRYRVACSELLKLALTFFRSIPLKRQHSPLPATECSAYSQHGIYTLSLTSEASLWKETKHNKMLVHSVSCSICIKEKYLFQWLGEGLLGWHSFEILEK